MRSLCGITLLIGACTTSPRTATILAPSNPELVQMLRAHGAGIAVRGDTAVIRDSARSRAALARVLVFQRARMTAASENRMNWMTTGYRRVLVTVDSTGQARRQNDTTPPRLEYDPGHPDADVNGFVAYPNVNDAEEAREYRAAASEHAIGAAILQQLDPTFVVPAAAE